MNFYYRHYLFYSKPAKSFCCIEISTIEWGCGMKKQSGEDRHLFHEENNSFVPGAPSNNRRPLVTTCVCPGPVVTRGMEALQRDSHCHNGRDALLAFLYLAPSLLLHSSASRSRPLERLLLPGHSLPSQTLQCLLSAPPGAGKPQPSL